MIYKGIRNVTSESTLGRYHVVDVCFAEYNLANAFPTMQKWHDIIAKGFQGDDLVLIQQVDIINVYCCGDMWCELHIYIEARQDVPLEMIERYFRYGVQPKGGEQ